MNITPRLLTQAPSAQERSAWTLPTYLERTWKRPFRARNPCLTPILVRVLRLGLFRTEARLTPHD
jgi:hypothetical protein